MALNKPSAQDVIDITQTTLPEGVVSSIIDDAAIMAESCLSSLDSSIQSSALKWLSAHLIASTSDQGSQSLSSQKLGDASESYSKGALGSGIAGTFYGQQAIALAPCLGRLGKPRASIQVV